MSSLFCFCSLNRKCNALNRLCSKIWECVHLSCHLSISDCRTFHSILLCKGTKPMFIFHSILFTIKRSNLWHNQTTPFRYILLHFTAFNTNVFGIIHEESMFRKQFIPFRVTYVTFHTQNMKPTHNFSFLKRRNWDIACAMNSWQGRQVWSILCCS